MNMENRKKELQQILENYTKHAQIIQTIEEMSELTKELCKHINGRVVDVENITEEMADVIIMLEQLKIIYKNEEKIEQVIDKKIKRTIERIKMEDKKQNAK